MERLYVESWKTEAYQAGWRAAESGTARESNPYRPASEGGVDRFRDWYDWNAAWLDRHHAAGRDSLRGSRAGL